MTISFFLHFYQPANQQRDILEAVVSQCYRPLLKGLLDNTNASLTLNISGGLLELLGSFGHEDILDMVRSLVKTERYEFTTTSCYHAFLPLLPDTEIRRQINLNNTVLKKYIGITPSGFFPPEMGYDTNLDSIIREFGFKYFLVDEIACEDIKPEESNNSCFLYTRSNTLTFIRRKNPSNLIMSGVERDPNSMVEALTSYANEYGDLVLAMDAETFGHHRPGLEKSLLSFLKTKDIDFLTLSQLAQKNEQFDVKPVTLRASTWASSANDIAKGIQFISWKDPENQIHTWQWELVHLMLTEVDIHCLKHPENEYIRKTADRALASDQFFWASAKPWWSLEMIESGAFDCLSCIEKLPDVDTRSLEKANTLYRNIVSTAFSWQRTGKIRELNRERNSFMRIPFLDRTVGVGGEEVGVYEAFITLLKDQEKKAMESREYEKAILWRDAVYKLQTKNDIYDSINAIDLLRSELSNEYVEKIIEKYKSKYREIRGGQPEQRSN